MKMLREKVAVITGGCSGIGKVVLTHSDLFFIKFKNKFVVD